MKKTYIKPTSEQHIVELTPLMEPSITLNNGEEASTSDNGYGEQEYTNSLSRGHSQWDD